MEKETNRWNIVFLLDDNHPNKIVLLKRSPEKSYAPNFYTGIGGKIGDLQGLEDESELDSAYRELSEETEGKLNQGNTKLSEFARCVYDDIGIELYYFWGLYDGETPPHVDSEVGNLEWVNMENLLEKEIIPTTKEVCREWSKRSFRTDAPFTVHVKEVGMDRTVRLIEVLKIEEGLR